MGRSREITGLVALTVTFLAMSVAVAQNATWKDCELSDRNPDRSIAACSKLLKRPSSKAHAAAFHHRGLAYAAKGKLDQAISDFSAAIRLDPQSVYRWQERGRLYARQGKYQQAIADFTEAIRRDPRALRFQSRGDAYKALGDLTRAIADYDEAIRLDTEARSFRFYARASALRDAGKYDRALADNETALKLEPTNVWALLDRGRTYARMGQSEKAKSDFDRALTLDPSNAELRHTVEAERAVLANAPAQAKAPAQANAPAQAKDTPASKPSTARGAKPTKPAAAPKPPAMSEGFKRNVAAAQAKLSPTVKSLLKRHGVQTKTGALLTDIFPEHRGKKLPGVGTTEGMTLDALDGVYMFDKKGKTIGISEFVKHDGQFIAMPPERTEAAVLHETGHALDLASGKGIKHGKFSGTKEFVDAYNADVATWPAETKKAFAYYLQGEGRGRAETFAELFAWHTGNKGSSRWDLRPYFPKLNKKMAGVVGTTLGAEPLELVKRENPDQPPVPARVPEGGRFGSGTGTTSKPPKDEPEEKPDDAKVAQQLTGAATNERQLPNASNARRGSRKVAKEMKWFFNLDRNDVVQLVCRIEGNNFIGDAQREVKPGESFFGVSYASLRVAKFGTVDVDAKGHGTLHPAR